MKANSLYNDQHFPEYILTDKVKSYLFVDFDIIFMNDKFWRLVKSYSESVNVQEIIIKNLEPDYQFIEVVDVSNLPNAFLNLVQTENLDGYFSHTVNLHLMTIKTLIYPKDNEDAFCILADRDNEIGIIGFSNSKKPTMFADFEIKDVPDHLRLIFPGRELPNDFKKSVFENWKLLSQQ